nr:MAG TPA: hypothetical protein [Caudoviricetes sp.]
MVCPLEGFATSSFFNFFVCVYFVMRFAVCLGKQFERFVMLSQQVSTSGTAVHGQAFEYGSNWQKVMSQNQTVYTDLFGRYFKTEYADGTHFMNYYNSKNQLVMSVTPGGVVTNTTYYPTGEVRKGDGATYLVEYTYNALGKQATMKNIQSAGTQQITSWAYKNCNILKI